MPSNCNLSINSLVKTAFLCFLALFLWYSSLKNINFNLNLAKFMHFCLFATENPSKKHKFKAFSRTFYAFYLPFWF
jgi:hypothetical protein